MEYETTEATGTILPIMWDAYRGVDVSVEQSGVKPGTVLNFEHRAAEYCHPVNLMIKAAKDFEFDTDILIADIRGGEDLPGGTRDQPINTFGEYAVVDSNGNIKIQTELEDGEDFRRYSFVPEQGMGPALTPEGDDEEEDDYEDEEDDS
jgi:hypothetical protein